MKVITSGGPVFASIRALSALAAGLALALMEAVRSALPEEPPNTERPAELTRVLEATHGSRAERLMARQREGTTIRDKYEFDGLTLWYLS